VSLLCWILRLLILLGIYAFVIECYRKDGVTSHLGLSPIDEAMHRYQQTANLENELGTNLIFEAGLNLQLIIAITGANKIMLRALLLILHCPNGCRQVSAIDLMRCESHQNS